MRSAGDDRQDGGRVAKLVENWLALRVTIHQTQAGLPSRCRAAFRTLKDAVSSSWRRLRHLKAPAGGPDRAAPRPFRSETGRRRAILRPPLGVADAWLVRPRLSGWCSENLRSGSNRRGLG